MPRLNVVEPADAGSKVKKTYTALEKDLGRVPNIFKGLANSPAALHAYLGIEQALSGALLDEGERHLVYLAASKRNECLYCQSAQVQLAKQAGLDDEAIQAVRRGDPADPKHRALVELTHAIMQTRGHVDDAALTSFRDAGYTDAHIAEVCALIAQSTFSNYFNHVNETDLDFPEAPPV